MDIATLIGIVGAFAMIVGSILIGGDIGAFINVPGILIVVGGTAMCVLTMQRLEIVLTAFKVAVNAFTYNLMQPLEIIERVVDMAQKARKEGMLALEREEIEYPFLAKGIQMAIDGSTPEAIKTVLSTEVAAFRTRHERGQGIFRFMESTAPSMGLIGTLIGLVQMLQTMDDPSSIGPAMAVALLTTFYGAIMAFVVCGPIAQKLENRTDEEALLMTITIKGVLAMVSGENPRTINEQLVTFLSPESRPDPDD
ncbi:MAG: motility protein A [Leptospirillia bacterium]